VKRSTAILFAACVLPAGAARADNWPQWRGPNFDGVSRETHLPVQWGPDNNILWRLKMPGMGASTPAVWGDRLFVTSQDDTDLVLVCASTEGKELWKRKLGSGKRMVRGDEGNFASASPCTDGSRVWAFVGSGELACFDFEGNEVWKVNLQERYGRFNIQFGMHSTPLLYGDRLYLQLIQTANALVIALDKSTGKEVWKIRRQSDGRAECEHSYASPCLWHNGKEAYLITHGNDYAIAHRLEDGSEIWRVGQVLYRERTHEQRHRASPVYADGKIYLAARDGTVCVVKAGPHFELLAKNKLPDVTTASPAVSNGRIYLRGWDSLWAIGTQEKQEK
jgi:outer membrane protein assembly factor BamB